MRSVLFVFFMSGSLALAHTKAEHEHGKCDHKAVQHGKHKDYLHDGVYHAAKDDTYIAHGQEVATRGSASTGTDHQAIKHDHKHGKGCGHKAIKHDKHTDYLHDGVLHAAHQDHYDDHGSELAN